MYLIKKTPIGKQIIEIESGLAVIDYLEQHDNDEMHRDIYLNNMLLVNHDDFKTIVNGDDVLTISYRPAGLDPVSLIVIGVVVSLVLIKLIPKPEIPSNAAQQSLQSSPNNQVSSQSNYVRKYQAVPNIFGRVISYPDLISNSIPEYVNNRRQVRELLLVGEGDYLVNQIRDDKTDIDNLENVTATVYGPNTYPSDLKRISLVGEIDGQELKAPDDPSIIWYGESSTSGTYNAQFVAASKQILIKSFIDYIEISDELVVVDGVNAGTYTVDSISVSGSDYTFTVLETVSNDVLTDTPTGFKWRGSRYTLDGSWSMVSVSGGGVDLDYFYMRDFDGDLSIGDNFTVLSGANAGNYTVNFISTTGADKAIRVNGSIPVIGVDEVTPIRGFKGVMSVNSLSIADDLNLSSGSFIYIDYDSLLGSRYATINSYTKTTNQTIFNITFTTNSDVFPLPAGVDNLKINVDGVGNVIGPFALKNETTEIWYNLSMPRGISGAGGTEISVTIRCRYQEIDANNDPVGPVMLMVHTFSGNTASARGYTLKIDGLPSKRYQVSASRETTRLGNNATEYVQIDEIFSVEPYGGESFGDVTVVDVLARSSNGASRSSSRKINLDVTRKINGVATTNFADCVKHLITSSGYPESKIDIDGLYDIADSLSENLKEFSYTFDDKNISLGEAVKTACNAARVGVYRDGQVWRFYRDEAKPRTYVFNRRNIASSSEQKQTMQYRGPSSNDSVELSYYNRALETKDVVQIKIDAENEQFIIGELGNNALEIDLAGCSNYEQALNRAKLEARKIVYQRVQVRDTILSDAANVDIGDRVAWCDIFDGDIFDGDIVSFSGETFATSEEIEIQSGEVYYALITNTSGQSMTPVQAYSVSGNKYAFTATIPESVLIADGYNVQAGSKYIIGKLSDIDATDYTLVERSGSDKNGRVSVELIQYTDKIYEDD